MSSSSSSGSLSSRLSTSSTSLSSTFSDVSYSSLAAVPSPSVSPPPAQHHKHSKTHAFFASPFSPPPSPPPTPPPPKVSKTHAFFASPFSPPPPPSSSLPPLQSSSSSQSKLAQPAPKRSLTASFFASKPPDVPVIIGPSTPPDNTPPLTTTTTTTTPSTGLALPNTFPKPKSRNLTQIPLSRLFPSRYSSDPHQLSQESSSIASHHQHNNHNATHTHTHHSHQKRNKREFLSLDTSHANASHHAQEYHNHIHHNHQYIPPQHPGSPHNLHPTWTPSSPTNSSRSISPITPSSPLSRQLSLPPRSEENGDDDENEIGDGEEAGDDRMDLRVEGKVGMGIDSETETERTPRPSHPESPLSYLLHHHQHQRQSQPPSHYQSELNLSSSPDKDAANESVLPDKIGIHREEDIDESVLSPGSIIRSPPSSASARYSPPTSSSSNHSLPPSPSSSTSYSDPTTVLRLLKPLGQGAFSSVWLARDESALPLAQVARSKVELVRKNSIRLKRNSSIKSRRGGGGGGGSIKRKVSSSRYTANATLDSEEDDDQIKGKHWTPLSRNSSLKSTLSRSDSTRSTRSNKSIASVASLASVGTTESTESDSVGSSRSSSGRSDGRGGVVQGVMRVKLGKGGVCGVRPMMGGAGRDGAGDGRIERGDGKEGETRFRVGLGLGLGLGMGVGMDMDLDLGNEGGTSDGCGQEGRLVAVKMTPLPKRYTGGGGRSSAEVEERDRMGVSFIREVEVLKVRFSRFWD